MSGPWGWFMTRDYVASRSETGGEGGIRTLGRALRPYDGLANRCFRPLSHLSGGLGISTGWYHSALLFHKNRHVRFLRHPLLLRRQAKSVLFHFLDHIVHVQANVLHRAAAGHRVGALVEIDDHQLAVR